MEEKNKRTEEKIYEEIQGIIKECTGVFIDNTEANLLKDTWEIPIVDWLFIIQEIEKIFKINLSQIITEENFEFFTIKGISKKIVEEA